MQSYQTIITVELDYLVSSTPDGLTLLDELLALGHYCNAKGIPFWVLTQRTPSLSLKILRQISRTSTGVTERDYDRLHKRLQSRTLFHAQYAIERAGLTVQYCTPLDIAYRETDIPKIHVITDFEERVLADNYQYVEHAPSIDEPQEIIIHSQAYEEAPHLQRIKTTFNRDNVSDNKWSEEAERHEKVVRAANVDPHKADHFRFIAGTTFPNQKLAILHLDDLPVRCPERKSESTFTVEVVSFLTVSEKIGLAADAAQLLSSDTLFSTATALHLLSLIRYLFHTQPEYLKRIELLAARFNEQGFIQALSRDQKASWRSLQQQILQQREKIQAQAKVGFAVEQFFWYYDLMSWRSSYPEDRTNVTIQDIILHAMREPTDAQGNGGNNTAQILYKKFGLYVEHDPEFPNMRTAQDQFHAPTFYSAWTALREDEKPALQKFSDFRNAMTTTCCSFFTSSHLKRKPLVDAQNHSKRSLVNLIAASNPGWMTWLLSKFGLYGCYSGDNTHYLFKSAATFGINTRDTSKTPEQLARDIISETSTRLR